MPLEKPERYSPLQALAKKWLLWVILPVVLVMATLYGMATFKSPAQSQAERTARDQEQKINDAMSRRR